MTEIWPAASTLKVKLTLDEDPSGRETVPQFSRTFDPAAVPVLDYEKAMECFLPRELPPTQYPVGDARSGVKGLEFQGSSPDRFRAALKRAFDLTWHRAPGHHLVFLKSWNEWAESNHLEPNLRDGGGYLEALKDETAREIAGALLFGRARCRNWRARVAATATGVGVNPRRRALGPKS